MIDGIDGLASIIGVVIFSVFGIIFYTVGYNFYFLLCLCLIGILLAYLRYNFSSKNKIFMGDTGSLIIGFCIGFLSLKFLSIDAVVLAEASFIPENKMIAIAAIFYIPLFDTLRVIGVRLLQKKSPFFPDNNHIHHILIQSGLKHYQASMFLGFLNLFLAVLFISLSTYFNSFQMLGLLVVSFGILLVVFQQLKINIKSQNKFVHLVRAIQFLF
jgi:UDP-N-acetylmuramyl pentapeptide phosphotransferase/UDP-N-acetylglucosamine-1-phosphate transferase